MKWFFWGAWCVVCFVSMILAVVFHLLLNLVSITWVFSFKNTVEWGFLHYTEEMQFEEGMYPYLTYVPDKNPWITFKRWALLDE